MTVNPGDRLPGATLIRLGDSGPQQVALGDLLAGRRVVIFAVPGAFTPTCHSAHMPSFVRTADALRGRGVDAIVCIAVNDPFVLDAWAKATGADTAGIEVLADPEAAFTNAIGMAFDAPPAGLLQRSQRYAMVVQDGVVQTFQAEEGPGVCTVSGGEAILETL